MKLLRFHRRSTSGTFYATWTIGHQIRATASAPSLRPFPTSTREEIFAATAIRLGIADPAICRPDEVLAGAMQQCLRAATSRAPFVLILDTCEYLSAKMHLALRRAITPLLREGNRCILVIASRSYPDVETELEYGSWLTEVPEPRRRIVPFDRHFRFTIEEIANVVSNASPAAPDELHSIARALWWLTMGLPMAIEPLVKMYKQGDLSIFADIQNDERLSKTLSILDEEKASRIVAEVVAERFLLHLNRSSDRQDLRDVIAIAVLRRCDLEILRHLWA
jgi:hypothetical protein